MCPEVICVPKIYYKSVAKKGISLFHLIPSVCGTQNSWGCSMQAQMVSGPYILNPEPDSGEPQASGILFPFANHH